jgi:hypothetical protein
MTFSLCSVVRMNIGIPACGVVSASAVGAGPQNFSETAGRSRNGRAYQTGFVTVVSAYDFHYFLCLESLIERFLKQVSQVFMPRVFECRTTS